MSAHLSAEWLELSGLPAELNRARAYAWPVFRKIVDLDCRRNRDPDIVEIALGELSERVGLDDWEKTAKILEALMKKKRLAAFLPDNPDETGLFQIRVPIATPIPPEEVAARARDPYLRDAASFRYLVAPERTEAFDEKVRQIVDLYLNALSQKMNSFIVDRLEALATRFELEDVRKMIDRAARLEIRDINWVAKELVRDAAAKSEKKKDGA